MNVSNIGNNIRRHMKLQGFTISNLSSRMGIGTATLSNILNGKSEPKSSTLIKFSDVLGVSINDLLTEIPQLQKLRFRTLKTLSAREKAEKKQIVISATQWLEDYKELENMLGEYVPYALKDLEAGNPEEFAGKAREHLGLDNVIEPVSDIADRIEKAGIKLDMLNFGFKQTFGLSIADEDKGPAIIVNSIPSISIERQIFTIAHELGHLLMHSGSYGKADDEENGNINEEEKEADFFAGLFLLPDDALINKWQESNGLHWVDAVLKIKKEYKVSYQTILVRLSQIEDSLHLDELRIKFAQDFKQKYNHDLKNHFEPEAISKYELVEDRYAKLVRMAYDKKIISISRASELLHKSIIEMRDLIKSWQGISIDA